MKYENFEAALKAARLESELVIVPESIRHIDTETEKYHECSWEIWKGGEKVGSLTVERSDGDETSTLEYEGETYEE